MAKPPQKISLENDFVFVNVYIICYRYLDMWKFILYI